VKEREAKELRVTMTDQRIIPLCSSPTVVGQSMPDPINSTPRWSPDDRWIAFQSIVNTDFDTSVQIVPSQGGESRSVARAADMRGFCWLPDGSGIAYSSSVGSTVLYPPTHNLRTVQIDGTGDRQITFGQVSYVDPDTWSAGGLFASSVRNQSDVWKFPVSGSPEDNTRAAVRITHQTGLAQTPSVSPDDTELAYLSDSGGHGNLWVARTDGSGVRQITFERDPATSVGVPVWSPTSNQIAFVLTRDGIGAQWLVNSDGSGLRRLVHGLWAYWSPDGRQLYYSVSRDGTNCIDKVPIGGGEPVSVRCDNAMAPALSADGSTLYFVTPLMGAAGGWDMEVRRATPENGPSTVLTRLSGTSIPQTPYNLHLIVSPDGRWLATPLTDGVTTNLWVLPAAGGPLRQLTDFGHRSVLIVRRISWSRDGKYLFAAVAETDADIVFLDGLVQTR
jgi:Tol biopolymer transport system component